MAIHGVMLRDIHCHVTEPQHAFLKRASAQTGLHVAELVRHALDHTYAAWMEMELHGPVSMDVHGVDLATEGDASSGDGFNGDMTGKVEDVDAKRYAQAGLVGLRGKSAERASEWVAQRTRVDADTLKTLLGAYLVLSRLNSLAKMARRVRGDG